MNDKVKSVLNNILDHFKTGDMPESVAFSVFPTPKNVPMQTWSYLNRFIAHMSGTMDARGFRQWQRVNRFVRKGARAVYILAPMFYKDKSNGKEELVLKGFKPVAVFRFEDTDGEKLDYMVDLPELPLMDVAKDWGISVKAIPGNYQYYGFYNSGRQEICLASSDEVVFFHELTHAAFTKNNPGLTIKDLPVEEAVAELGALALCRLVGKSGDKYLKQGYRYIAKYAEDMKKSPLNLCLQVLEETEKAIQLILKGGDKAESDIPDIAA